MDLDQRGEGDRTVIDFTKLAPLHDNVLLELKEVENVSEAGLILPGSATPKVQLATVLATGPGKLVDGEYYMSVAAGDIVMVAGWPEGEKYLVVPEAVILGVYNG